MTTDEAAANIPAYEFARALPPYTMCSREECLARQSSGEISFFERVNHPSRNGLSRASSNRMSGNPKSTTSPHRMDPCLAVAKYRRSAAGLIDSDRSPPRTLHQLQITVQYLQILLIDAPTVAPDGVTHIPSWITVVEFVQDRLRAVQVDLIRTRQSSYKPLQYRIVRTFLLLLYLLADSPDYASKFGRDALQAALSNYWADPVDYPDMDDEILSYTLLIHHARPNAIGEESLGFTELYRLVGRVPSLRHPRHRFQWSLRVVVAWSLGHWFAVLRLLDEGAQTAMGFDVLARCCVAPHLPWIRSKVLEVGNFAWAKGECISTTELARLLFFRCRSRSSSSTVSTAVSSSVWGDDDTHDKARTSTACPGTTTVPAAANGERLDAVMDFCQFLGLPAECDQAAIRFKVAPLQQTQQQQLLSPTICSTGTVCSVRDDEFICRYATNEARCGLYRQSSLILPPPTWMHQQLLAATDEIL